MAADDAREMSAGDSASPGPVADATTFARTYVAQLRQIAMRTPLPRIRALHLPPVQEIEDNRGEFCAVELEDGALGLSYVRFEPGLRQHAGERDPYRLAGADAQEVAAAYAEADGLRKTLGFAAANAITRCLMDRVGFVPPRSKDSIGGLQPHPGEAVGMIGFFKPLLGSIAACGARLTVVELNPDLVTQQPDYTVTLDPAALGPCRQVLATGTLLLNDTLDTMLAACRSAHHIALIGPSAMCLPDGLFARRITLVGGAWVTDTRGFADALRRGESRSRFAAKFALTPDCYPGFETLLKGLAPGLTSC